MKRLFLILLFTATPVLTSAISRADNFAYMGTNTGDFGTIDLTTGAFTLLGNSSVTLAGMDAFSATLYGVSYNGNTLYSVNPTTGSVTAIGSSASIAYDDFGGTLLGLYGVGTDANLYSINASTGAATLIGSTGLALNNFRALSSNSTTLYFADDTNLYTLNPATGNATLVGSMGGPGIGALLYESGTLFGGTDSPTPLRVDTLSTATGTATSGPALTGTTGQFYALAAYPVVPEPATWLCLALGGALLVGLLRRTADARGSV